MENKKRGQLALGIACAILAFIVTLQIKSTGLNTARNAASAARNENLQQLLYAEQDKTERLYEQVADYSAELERLRDSLKRPGGESAELTERVAALEALAGVNAVEGPGLTVTLEPVISSEQPEGVAYDVTHSDLLEIINDLNSAGAEAVAINGFRVIGTSAIETHNRAVLIDKTPLKAPYVISAIGDAAALEAIINARQGPAETLSQWGIKVSLVKSDKLIIEAYKGRIARDYAVSR